jgi:hypothetical protein
MLTCGSNADLKHGQNIALLLPVQLLHLQQLLLHYYRQPQQAVANGRRRTWNSATSP